MFKRYLLIIGPLPPPFGGARVSFELFLNYISKYSNVNIKHFDLPIRYSRYTANPGRVNHLYTLINIIKVLFVLPLSSSLIIFGSRNFCFSYGLVLLLASYICMKSCFFRFFGGRPMLGILNRNYIIRKTALAILNLIRIISLETEFGAKEFPHNLQKKIIVVPGYRTKVFGLKIKKKFQEKTTFIYAGSISKEKGIGILLDAFSELRKCILKERIVELNIYGTGSLSLISRINREKQINYYGSVNNDFLRKNLSLNDVFVFPSIYNNEGHPGVIIESLIAGLPIIASDSPIIREILKTGYNALLVDPGNIHQLKSAMEKLVVDKKLRNQLSENALVSSVKYETDIVLPKLASTLGIQENNYDHK